MDLATLLGDVDVNTSENIDKVLQQIAGKEQEINTNLETLLTKQCTIETKLCGIGRSLNSLNAIGTDAKKLNTQIVQTAQLAESVSAKVRRLDLARSRASECQKRVHDLIDLQLCSKGVLAAIADEDYEQAAGHIGRFLAMDQQMLQRTADDVQGNSVTSVSEAVKTLEGATENLRELITRRFDEAVAKDDLASVERFFKIYPLLGLHEAGIEKFSNYICSKLSQKAQKELRNALDIAKAEKRVPVAYADTMTAMLENFARVIEVNQPIIEACYGAGYLLDMVAILQRECDAETKNVILEFNRQRQIPRRIQQIKENQRPAGGGAASAAGGGGSGGGVGSGMQQALGGHYRKPSGGSVDKLNPKDIDTIIAEITVMHSRAELYFRFMKRRVTNDIEASGSSSSTQDKETLQAKKAKLEKLLLSSGLSRQMQELLGTYLLFERYFMEESVVKAIALNSYEIGQQTSSMVDDVFFILRKSIRRSFKTQSVNGTCAVINNAAACLDGDFVHALKAPLKAGFPTGYIDLAQAYNAIQSTLQQGKLQSNDSEKARANFLINLNNADVATEYIDTLWQTMAEELQIVFNALTSVEQQIIDSCFSELKAVRAALKACVDFGLQQLRSSAIKPRLHPWVDQFLNYSHYLTEEELSAYEAGETFVQFLIVQIDGLLNSFKLALTSRNYDALVSIIATEVTTRLERAIKKSTFNRLGGLVLDQEVRTLGAYLTGATSWSVRDKMTRLTQIATVLNLEKVAELEDYWDPENANEMPSWRLTPNEVRTILTLRTDFRMEDIKRVQL